MHKVMWKKAQQQGQGLFDGSFGKRQQRHVRTYVLRRGSEPSWFGWPQKTKEASRKAEEF